MAPTWSLFFTTSPKLWEQDAWKAAVGVRVPIFAPGTPDPAFKGITDRDRSAVIQLAELIQKTKGKEEKEQLWAGRKGPHRALVAEGRQLINNWALKVRYMETFRVPRIVHDMLIEENADYYGQLSISEDPRDLSSVSSSMRMNFTPIHY